jgi:hypothetical protein
MQQNIRIGMPKQALFVGDGYATYDEVAPLDQLVHIKTLPDSHFDHFLLSSPYPPMLQTMLLHRRQSFMMRISQLRSLLFQ